MRERNFGAALTALKTLLLCVAMDRLKTLLRLSEFHRLHPLQKRGKKPLLKEWPDLEVIEKDIRHWFAREMNFGLITDRAAVLDFDDKGPAREFFVENRRLIKTIVETRRGIHFYFRNEDQTRNTTGTPDVRGIGGYVVSAGSVVGDHLYGFVDGYDEIDPANMEPLREEWLPKRDSVGSVRGQVTDGVKYIMQIHAISGNGGHNATFRACCKLRDSGMSEAEALAAMVDWNRTNANPPWETKELLHKVKSAYSEQGV